MRRPDPTIAISLDEVTRCFASRIPLYRWRRPTYQAALFRSLGLVWHPKHKRVLDVGGGTGIVAQTIKDLFPVDRVVSVDIADRYLEGLDIETATYNGRTLPFNDGEFDCVLLCNVLHHVPKDLRVPFLKECARVAGTLYIKDHLAELSARSSAANDSGSHRQRAFWWHDKSQLHRAGRMAGAVRPSRPSHRAMARRHLPRSCCFMDVPQRAGSADDMETG